MSSGDGGNGGDGDRLAIERLLALPLREREIALRALTGAQVRAFNEMWAAWAHSGQLAPPGDWRVWLIRAGRGFGKTRAGAEWVSDIARTLPGARIALVGGTIDDVRKVMVEGDSGLLAVARAHERPRWQAGLGELAFDSGAKAYAYSAEAADKLRGPQHHAAWGDELAKWRDGEKTWDNLLLGLRIGDRPRALVTTTPRPNRLMRRVLAMRGLVETRGATHDNPHLPATFVAAMEADYAGTRLGRQELDGEMIEEVAGALWTRAGLEACRIDKRRLPRARRVVVAVDPPAGIGGDACGIVAAMLGEDGRGYVLEDASVGGLPPSGWARAVVRCARRRRADLIVAEGNNGGEMVRNTLAAVDATLPVRIVHASRAKAARAEPVSALYDQGKVRHVGGFPDLEDEMCALSPEGYFGRGRSPDRADALVWAMTALMLRRQPGTAAVRMF
ncbi:DNA-packaging protein [uncultured Sphingomonas sp.]|uniref:DNA-packaging protein n=1 Tax=uncultured Sphingomonas sp. TaxID=158754 RepID=UPI0035C9DF2B